MRAVGTEGAEPGFEFEDARLSDHLREIAGDEPVSTFGFEPLDELVGGAYPGRLAVLGAEPGAGKTTLLVQMADGVARQGHPAIFASLELPAYRLVTKSLARLSGGALTLAEVSEAMRRGVGPLLERSAGDAGRVCSPGDLGDGELTALEAAVRLYEATVAKRLAIVTPASVEELGRAIADCLRATGRVPVVFVDYLQLLATADADALVDERVAIAQCVSRLRRLCNCYGTPVVAISSIARGHYRSRGPSLDMYGGSGAIEYAADVALYLAKDREAVPMDGRSAATLCVVKARYGATGAAALAFDGAHATFTARD